MLTNPYRTRIHEDTGYVCQLGNSLNHFPMSYKYSIIYTDHDCISLQKKLINSLIKQFMKWFVSLIAPAQCNSVHQQLCSDGILQYVAHG